MKKIKLSLIVMALSASLLVAGGETNSIISVSSTSMVEDEIKEKENKSISSIYLGGGLSFAEYDSTCKLSSSPSCDNQSTKAGLSVRVGYDFNEYVGLEVRGILTGNLTHIGLFAKPMYNIREDLNLYVLGGLAQTTTDTNFRNTDVFGLAFGVGLEYDFLEDEQDKEIKYNRKFDGLADQEEGFGLFMDYEKLYFKKNAPSLDALNVGLTYDF